MPAKANPTVLFQKGKDDSGTLWDDSELIVAWSKQLDRIRALTTDGERREPIPIAGDRGVDADPETPTRRSSAAEDEDDGPIEFAASGDDSDDDVEEGAFYFNDGGNTKAAATNEEGNKKEENRKEGTKGEKKTRKGNSNNNNNISRKGPSSSSSSECGDDDADSECSSLDLSNAMMRPAIPKGVDKALAGMLKAWYEAGYRTGEYAATRKFKKQQQHKEENEQRQRRKSARKA